MNFLVLSFAFGLLLAVVFLFLDSRYFRQFYDRIIFIFAFIPLSIYIITSTSNFVGKGLIIGIGFVNGFELLKVRNNPDIFRNKFLGERINNWKKQEIDYLTYFFLLLVIFILIITIVELIS